MMKASAGAGVVAALSFPEGHGAVDHDVQVRLLDVDPSLVDQAHRALVHVDAENGEAAARQDGCCGQPHVAQPNNADRLKGWCHAASPPRPGPS